MNTQLKNGILFLGGVAIGFLVARFTLKERYEAIAQEEIDSVKTMFNKENINKESDEQTEEKKKELKYTQEKSDITDYIQYSKKVKEYKSDNTTTDNILSIKAKSIEPEKFGMDEEYDQVTYILYSDGVVASEQGEVISDEELDAKFEDNFKDAFGEFGEDDAAYFRNEALKMEYEIIYDPNKKYYDSE